MGNETIDSGYSIDKINDLIVQLSDIYKDMVDKEVSDWATVRNTMGNNWVGEDEYACEKELAARIVELDGKSYEVISNLVSTIRALGNAWIEMQSKNYGSETLSISGSIDDTDHLANSKGKVSESVKAADRTFDASTNRGVTAGSQATIQTQITEYIKAIQTIVTTAEGNINSASAFLGDTQSKSIDAYITTITDAIKKIERCVKTIFEALGAAVDNQAKSAEEVAELFNNAASNVSVETNNDELDLA